MQQIAQYLFWACSGLVLYSYVLYPVLLGFLFLILRPRSATAAEPDSLRNPSAPAARVAVVISAYNEEAHIESRIQNLLDQDYPPDLLRIYIGSDGSTDGTHAVLQRIRHPRIQVYCFETNRGKANVLNELMTHVLEPFVVFTDANTIFDPAAVRRLLEGFDSKRVGCVSGELRILRSEGDNQDSILWRMEQILKLSENALGGSLGANGAIYAIRREFFRPLDADAVIDDFLISMSIAAQGHTILYRHEALAYEDAPPSMADEYRRRIRIGIGNYQALFRHPEYLTSTSIPTRFTYISHKVLRWASPVLLMVALLANCLLIDLHPYAAILLVQTAGYGACFVLYRLRNSIRLTRLLALPVQLAALNFAFLVALWRFFRGNYGAGWQRTRR